MPTTTSPPILIWQPGGGVPGGPISNPPVYSQHDVTPLVQGQAYVDVVFGSVQTTEDWVLVECNVVNELDLAPLNIWPGIITDRTTAGFRLQLNGMPDSENYYLHWAVSGVNILPVPATLYLFTGPTSGAFGVDKTFTVRLPPSTTLVTPITVTPDDGGAGGTFAPTSVTLSSGSGTATFTYAAVAYGAVTLSVTNSGTLLDPAPIVFTSIPPVYTFSGPTGGTSGVPSTNFTVQLAGDATLVVPTTVTPHDGGAGGTFTPTSVSLVAGVPVHFTYTPSSSGDKTISVTNDGGLTNPGNLTYTVTAAVIFYRSLTVDHTKVPSTQTNFPVLVSVTDATLKSVANGGHVKRSDGFDIGFFSDSAGTTPLKWEIDKYVPTTGELVAWIKIASLSSTVDTVFYVRYGDPTITTDNSDKVNVWSNSYAAVYHLGDGTTLNATDSLGAFNGTFSPNPPTATTGKIGGGGDFLNSSTQYISLGTVSSPPAATISCWAKATAFPIAYNCLITRLGQLMVKSNGKLYVGTIPTGGGISYDGTGVYTLSTGTWYYISASYDSVSGLIAYVNAAVDGTIAPSGTLNAVLTAARIASDPVSGGREWNGAIDEMHVSSVARSANWITTEYNNQNAPGTFITVGVET